MSSLEGKVILITGNVHSVSAIQL